MNDYEPIKDQKINKNTQNISVCSPKLELTTSNRKPKTPKYKSRASSAKIIQQND